MKRVIRWTYSLILLAAVLITAVLVLLSRFDLNSYRSNLEERIGATLGLPVTIGHAHFAPYHGISISLDDVRIGGTEGGLKLVLPRTDLSLEPWPLLLGQLQLRDIRLLAPELTLPHPGAHPSAPPGDRRAPALIPPTSLPRIDLVQGVLHLPAAHGQSRRIDHIQLAVRPQRIALSALLQQPGAPAQARLQLDWTGSLADWRGLQLDLSAQIDQAQPTIWAPVDALKDAQALSLTLEAHGRPQEGVILSGRVAELQDGATPPLELTATWRSTEESEHIDPLELRLRDSRLQAQLDWPHGAQAQATLRLTSDDLHIDDLQAFLPRHPDLRWTEAHLRQLTAELGYRPRPEADLLRWEVRSANGQLDVARLQLAEVLAVDNLHARLRMDGDTLQVHEGTAALYGAPVHLSASLAEVSQPRPRLIAEVEGRFPAGRWQQQTQRLPAATLGGDLPFQLLLTGQGRQWHMESRLDLTPLRLQQPPFVDKRPGQTAQLLLRAGAGQTLTASLGGKAPLMTFSAHPGSDGTLHRPQLAVTVPTLTDWHAFSPLLKDLRMEGGLRGEAQVQDPTPDLPFNLQGHLDLDNIGLYLHGIVADMRQITTRLDIDGGAVTIAPCEIQWGPDPVKVEGRVADLRDPVVELQATAKQLRADSLIFSSPTMTLRDLDGRVLFSRKGIEFAPVKVRLDGGTRATVTGGVYELSYPRTDLDVTASYGNIDEVINLFIGPHKGSHTGKKGGKASSAYAPVTVRAQVQKGHIGALPFTDATAVVRHHQGWVIVDDIVFRSGDGGGTGRVRYDAYSTPPDRLEVTGHVENIDADGIYKQFFKEVGLVTGRMTADFNVAGQVGPKFLATSHGAAQVQIDKGVLRKFTFLSKVFSLLNVSQIFKGNVLPDMAKEGMPFNRLQGSLALEKGVVHTENLRIDSEAMNLSLVGDIDLAKERVDFILAVMPLVTVDRVVSHIPLVGWIVGGEERALITTHFQVKGSRRNPEVTPIPATSVSDKVLGIFKRVFGLPGKVVTDPGRVLGLPEEDSPPADKKTDGR